MFLDQPVPQATDEFADVPLFRLRAVEVERIVKLRTVIR